MRIRQCKKESNKQNGIAFTQFNSVQAIFMSSNLVLYICILYVYLEYFDSFFRVLTFGFHFIIHPKDYVSDNTYVFSA